MSQSSVTSLWLALCLCSVLGFTFAYGCVRTGVLCAQTSTRRHERRFIGLYLNWKNVDRGKVLGLVQWLPVGCLAGTGSTCTRTRTRTLTLTRAIVFGCQGPFMIATGVVVMMEGDGWIGVFAGLLFFVVRTQS